MQLLQYLLLFYSSHQPIFECTFQWRFGGSIFLIIKKRSFISFWWCMISLHCVFCHAVSLIDAPVYKCSNSYISLIGLISVLFIAFIDRANISGLVSLWNPDLQISAIGIFNISKYCSLSFLIFLDVNSNFSYDSSAFLCSCHKLKKYPNAAPKNAPRNVSNKSLCSSNNVSNILSLLLKNGFWFFQIKLKIVLL